MIEIISSWQPGFQFLFLILLSLLLASLVRSAMFYIAVVIRGWSPTADDDSPDEDDDETRSSN